MVEKPINSENQNLVEVRAFNFLKKVFDERQWSFPYFYELGEECTASELAKMMDLPLEKIEAVFINGCAKPLAEGWVKPGDRVAFVPYGTPGPYRVLLGFFRLNEDR
ncbi:MAG: MoaD/ThiS family protein [Eubacteriales bacterium]